MRIGYPCINLSVGCTANSTFRLRNYSSANLIEKVTANLACLQKILEFNRDHDLLFFRISSDVVPFASHPVCEFDWVEYFAAVFRKIGALIKKNSMRISMHPDQFVLLNALRPEVVEKSIRELEYHCAFLDALGLGEDARVQIHVGGVYGNKQESMRRFAAVYRDLPASVRRRLSIENDDRSYSLADCLEISAITGIPVVFDNFHHECLNNGETMGEAVRAAAATWGSGQGPLMADYSSQQPGGRRCAHAQHIDIEKFGAFLDTTRGTDFDIMLEIKDKEKSAVRALAAARALSLNLSFEK